MTDERCIEVKELAEVLACGPDDPRRRHLDGCPRCLALAASFEGFMAGREDQSGLATEELARMDQALAREMVGERESRRWPRWLVAVPAAAAVLAFFFASPWERSPLPDPTVMRGEVQPDTLLATHPVRQGEHGEALLSWEPSALADSYVVELLGEDLGFLTQVTVGDTLLEASPESVREAELARYWRVIGFKEGDPVVRSGLREFPR